jgi:ATP-dependent Clp protease ATP-binding subunit ClpA
MRLDKLTTKLQEALADAQSHAVGHDNQYIEPIHLLTALLNQDDGGSRSLLQRAGVNVNGLTTAMKSAMERGLTALKKNREKKQKQIDTFEKNITMKSMQKPFDGLRKNIMLERVSRIENEARQGEGVGAAEYVKDYIENKYHKNLKDMENNEDLIPEDVLAVVRREFKHSFHRDVTTWHRLGKIITQWGKTWEGINFKNKAPKTPQLYKPRVPVTPSTDSSASDNDFPVKGLEELGERRTQSRRVSYSPQDSK